MTGIYNQISSWFPNNVQAFLVSIFLAVLAPLSPLLLEWLVSGEVKPENWTITGVVFAAAIASTSRNQAVLILGFLAAAFLAFVYGGELMAARAVAAVQHSSTTGAHTTAGVEATMSSTMLAPGAAEIVIGFIALTHAFERFGRHWVEGKPFLEFGGS